MYIRYDGNSVKTLPELLRQKVEGCDRRGVCEWRRLQSNGIWVYEHYFASDVRVLAGLLELLGRRIRGFKKPVPLGNGAFKTAPGFCTKMASIELQLVRRGNQVPSDWSLCFEVVWVLFYWMLWILLCL